MIDDAVSRSFPAFYTQIARAPVPRFPTPIASAITGRTEGVHTDGGISPTIAHQMIQLLDVFVDIHAARIVNDVQIVQGMRIEKMNAARSDGIQLRQLSDRSLTGGICCKHTGDKGAG